MVPNRWHTLALVFLVSVMVGACAARGARQQTRVAALSVGEAALAIDQAERTVFAANIPGYDAAAHNRVGVEVLKVLRSARAFERAAAAWPEDATAPETVDAARVGLLAALADLERVVPPIAAVRDPLLRALAAIRAALTAV